tara:strand:+ start:707 stop:1237 length:531 start_codon:yes stop_codon:yes gene_type:complete
MKNNYIIILITILLSLSFSEIKATTEDGKKVVLHNNGTWKFENPAENAKFNLVEFIDARFEKHEKHFGREEKPYNAHVRGFFQFQNNSDKKVVAIQYKFALVDAFDEILYESIVKDNIIIKAGERNSLDSYYYWEDSFENNDIYDKIIAPVTSNNLRAKIKILMIAFDNGTKIKYN